MKLVVVFVKENQSIARQYTRRFNNQPIYKRIVETLKTCEGIPFEVWTDIKEINEELLSQKIKSVYLEEKSQCNYESDINFFLNPNTPFISKETITRIWNEINSVSELDLIYSNEKVILTKGYFEINSTIFKKEQYNKKNISINEKELVDISNKQGWWIAEKNLLEKKILIHPLSATKLGTGHIFRGLTIASQLIIDHDVAFLFRRDQKLGIDMVKAEGYEIITYDHNILDTIRMFNPDIVINDLLNTSKEYVLGLKEINCRIINFEDMGEGAVYADAVINALYPGDVPQENFYTGEQYYCIREDFIGVPKKELTEEVREVLITYGGEDPQFLTKITLQGLAELQRDFKFIITIILGPAFSKHEELNLFIQENNLGNMVNVHKMVENMAQYMRKADIVFTSAGRTMYEIATIGTPAVVTAQNYRELTHTFGHPYNGFYNLGYCGEVDSDIYYQTAKELIINFELRKLMHKRMMKNDFTSGIERVKQIILGELVLK